MRHVELIISHMADLLLCGYTAEDVGVCLGHSDEEGDVVAVSSVRHLRLLSGKDVSIAVLPLHQRLWKSTWNLTLQQRPVLRDVQDPNKRLWSCTCEHSMKLQLQHKVTETNILLYYILCNVIVIENDIFLKLITIKNYPK